MIKTVVTDFSKVLLFAKDKNYHGGLNALNKELLADNPNFTFFDHFVLNDELLDYYEKLKSKMPVYIFTTESVQDHPAITGRVRSCVSGVLSAKELGLSKADSGSYVTIADLVRCKPDEILYIDDKEANIEAAAKAGLNAVLYTSNREIMARLDGVAVVGN